MHNKRDNRKPLLFGLLQGEVAVESPIIEGADKELQAPEAFDLLKILPLAIDNVRRAQGEENPHEQAA